MTAIRGIGVRVEGLHVAHRRHVVLDVPLLDLPAGETTVVLGPSGAGKSTLLGIIGLLERATGGRVTFDGREVTVHDHEARLATAAVFQRPFLFKGTVGVNVAYGLRLRGVPDSERSGLVAEVLEQVGLAGWQERSALTLSGGEAQRVALARALVLKPRLLLLDEPLASLDPVLKYHLAREFADLFRTTGATVLYVTHDQDEALTVADRIAVLRDGRVAATGAADDVMGLAVDEWSARFLGMEPAVRGVVSSVEDGLARISCDGADVFAVADFPLGAEVLLGVRPEDILLFEGEAELPISSARNRLTMRVTGVQPRGATVSVTLETGAVRLAAAVSRRSAADLAIAHDTRLLAVFKATAVRVRSIGHAPASPLV